MPTKGDRSKNKKKKRIPSGKSITVYKKTKKRIVRCGLCKQKLKGIPTKKESKLSKTKKRPTAKFGGMLCNKCREKIIIETIKVKEKIKKIEELEINTKKFISIKR